ncbi:MAG: glycosyltransferase [Tepidisphaeraceae bacterium]
MRVLHVISSIDPRSGGTAATVLNLSRAQVTAGLDVSLAATWRKGDDVASADVLRRAGVSVELIGPCTTPLLWHRDIARLIDQQVASADVVHIHAIWEEIQHQAAKSCRRASVPYVMLPQGMLDPWSLAQRKLKKALYLRWRLRKDLNGASAMHFTTEAERNLVAPLGLTPPVIVEPLGVDMAEFETLPPPGTFRDRFPQIAGRRIVLFLSRLHYKKGLDLLINAFANVAIPEAVLVLAGPVEAAYRSQLEAIIVSRGLSDRVIFTGMLHGSERVAALADAELFVLPSHQENFGIAVVEAVAAGTPVLISDQVNIWREIVEAGVGSAVPVDVAAISQELKRWLTDGALRNRAAERARAFARERYDWNIIAQRWVGHYARLVNEPASAATPGLGAQARGRQP